MVLGLNHQELSVVLQTFYQQRRSKASSFFSDFCDPSNWRQSITLTSRGGWAGRRTEPKLTDASLETCVGRSQRHSFENKSPFG